MEDKVFLNNLYADMKAAFRASFWVAVLGIALCFCMDNWSDLMALFTATNIYGKSSVFYVHYYVFNAYSFGGVFVGYFACMLAAVPYATSYSCDEYGGITIYIVQRTALKNYAKSKILATAFSGGMAFLLGTVLFIFPLLFFLPVVTPQKLLESQDFPYYFALQSGSGICYIIIILGMTFLSGALSSCVGLCVSAWYPNACVAICAPLLFQLVLVEIGRLFCFPSGVRLDRILKARGVFISDGLTLFITPLVVLGLCYACYRLFLHRIANRIEG